jgi:hypothetical protein
MKNFQNKTKIIKISKIIRHILFAGLVLWAIGIPVVMLQIIMNKPVVSGLNRVGLQGSFVLVLVFTFLVNLRLFRFFDRLKNGFLFDTKTVSHLDAAGKWWIVLWLFKFLYCQIGHEVLNISNGWGFSNLFAGLTLIFVAWLLKEAQDLQEEQELTV